MPCSTVALAGRAENPSRLTVQRGGNGHQAWHHGVGTQPRRMVAPRGTCPTPSVGHHPDLVAESGSRTRCLLVMSQAWKPFHSSASAYRTLGPTRTGVFRVRTAKLYPLSYEGVEPAVGVEPTTPALRGQYLTVRSCWRDGSIPSCLCEAPHVAVRPDHAARTASRLVPDARAVADGAVRHRGAASVGIAAVTEMRGHLAIPLSAGLSTFAGHSCLSGDRISVT